MNSHFFYTILGRCSSAKLTVTLLIIYCVLNAEQVIFLHKYICTYLSTCTIFPDPVSRYHLCFHLIL